MSKACIGGALVVMAVCFTPSPTEPTSSFHGGQIVYPNCSGTMELLDCASSGQGRCFEKPLNFGFSRETESGRDQTPGNTRFVCTSQNCVLNVATQAAKSPCNKN
jgi:hypothetical protein